MSWYFFGGFSAYAIVPSGSFVNQSGWSRTHGWSGETCMAKSSAISRPASRARATNASKSSSVPSAGWIASWPPSAAPMAHAELEHDVDVHAGRDLEARVAPPEGDRVVPGLDRERPAARRGRRDLGLPHV